MNSREVVRRFEEMFGDEDKWWVNVTHDRVQFMGSEEQIEAAAQLVAELNAASSSPGNESREGDSSTKLHVFRSGAVDADLARRVLSTLMEGSKDFRIEVGPTNKQLVVAGTPDEMKQVDSLLKTLSELAPSGSGQEN